MSSSLFSAVSAGIPLPADNYGEPFDVSGYLNKHPSKSFYVRVDGDSMINAGIFDGDILVVDKTLEPHDGSVVIARLHDGFTVKTYELKTERLRLVPANSHYLPLESSEDYTLVGAATYVIH